MGKQPQLAGMEQPKNKVIVKLATKYAEKRDARLKAGKEESTAKSALLTGLKENKLDRYEDVEDDILVILEKGKENVKVKTLSEQDGDEEDESEDE